jgi:hypothetical protein
MMMIYDVISTFLNVHPCSTYTPPCSTNDPHDPPMFFHVSLMFVHAPRTLFKDLQTFDDTSLMHSKALLGFNHQPWVILP